MTLKLLLLMLLVLPSAAIAQESSTSPQPTPRPAVRRPGLDQFGLSSGVLSGTQSGEASASARAIPTEKVDESTYEIISQVTEKSRFMEGELLRALQGNVDISPNSKFHKYFMHHVGGLGHVISVQRTGEFGGAGIKPGEITRILQENERTILEIDAVLSAGAAEYAQFKAVLDTIAKKYGVAMMSDLSGGTPLNKPELLKVMMSRINSNFSTVKKSMVVGK